MNNAAPIPITILTGFLGSGKTTLILNLLPQLPSQYKLALLKNEFGDVAVDSQLASRSSIAGVQELLTGCICCNLVGQLGDALQTLRDGVNPTSNDETPRTALRPDRIIIETSGSAFPATLAMEVNRLARETGSFVLDGVISVIDVENWQGYEDTSVTAKMQARYTDIIILNKWEHVSERRLDDVLDRVGDLELDPPVPCVKSQAGMVDREALLGLDGSLAQQLEADDVGHHSHGHETDHQSEVEVISAVLDKDLEGKGVNSASLEKLLHIAPKDEIYRIKGVILTTELPKSSDGEPPVGSSTAVAGKLNQLILNYAFGRWTYTWICPFDEQSDAKALHITIVTAKYESTKWMRRLEAEKLLRLTGSNGASAQLQRSL